VTTLVEKSKMTVDGLIAKRHEPQTYEEKVRHALDVVEMHLQEENPDRIDECIRLYTDDAIWEAPARKVSYEGRDLIKKMYLRVFSGVVDFEFTPVELRRRTGCSTIPMPASRSPEMRSRIAHTRSAPKYRCASFITSTFATV
jgi:hypothetical protein